MMDGQGLTAMEAVGLDGVADSVLVNAQLAGDGADLPMLGVKVTANLDVGFRIDHLVFSLDRGIRGKGSTKWPLRPQRIQHNNRMGCGVGRPWHISDDPEV